MKKIVITLLLINVVLFTEAQETFNKFIEVGIANHDEGKYEEAIKYYKKALEIKPKSELANYEISLSYFRLKEYKKVIEYSDKILKEGEKHKLAAYINKGSALDMLGKTKKSIKVFKKAIEELGHHYLLDFNLAIDYLKVQKVEEAEVYLKKAVEINPTHSSSHFYLAKINNNKGNRIPTLLASYFFLLLEPNTIRSEEILTILKSNLQSGVKKKDNGKDVIMNLNLNVDSEFSAADMMVSMLEASKTLEKNEGKTEAEMFVENTESLFKILGELNEDNKRKTIWWTLYVPMLNKIAKSEYIETYCKYITQLEIKSQVWLEENEGKVSAFFKWLEEENQEEKK
ncbi:tetratricopeptide repeat protein [Tenacibaculum amylolyticum]|uniref:tetratricopeptide repeat protein n=1 Tax=Tenacibaculum amylolyticum TaxID=104269 RepID=UPI003896530E